ncbi:MAG: ATP-binding protein [Gammaproteobacteria bacterium]|nr:MAG: ATP-binding protein [Gammaproteobacteria bacterium]
MGDVAYDLHRSPAHNVEIIVHVDETLGESRRGDLVEALEGIDGVMSAEFCPLRYHLMLINYDREAISSQDVLVGVVSQNIHAELIGPV